MRFFLLCFSLIVIGFPLWGMSEKKKVIALADIWNNVNNQSISVKRHYDKSIDWNIHDYGWNVELLSGDTYYAGVVLARYDSKTQEKRLLAT